MKFCLKKKKTKEKRISVIDREKDGIRGKRRGGGEEKDEGERKRDNDLSLDPWLYYMPKHLFQIGSHAQVLRDESWEKDTSFMGDAIYLFQGKC